MIIYKVTNLINQKVYIGQSINSLEHRRAGHYRDARCSKKKSVYFHNALLKYAESAFKWEVIEEVTTREELDLREQYWINYYQSNLVEKGYNLKAGGQFKGGVNSQSTLEKLRKSTKLLWENPETATKMLAGLRKGVETAKKKALTNFKTTICKHCGKEFKYRPMDFSNIPKYCSQECRDKQKLIHVIKASTGAKKQLAIKYEAIDKETKEKVINWVKTTTILNKVSYNNLSNIFKELSIVTGLKDARSVMRPFRFTSRKKFVKELLKIYAEQV